MGSLALLLAGTILAVPPETGRTLPLRLKPGQEFIYHTRCIPDAGRPGSPVDQWLDTYVLILDATPQGRAQAAFMTVQIVKAGAQTVPVARLERGNIDESGRVTLNATSSVPRLPIEAPPTLEIFPFLELPASIPENGRPWQTTDPDMGLVTWRHLHFEQRDRGRCLKVQGEQSSGSVNQVGVLSWQRTETIWLLEREGYVDHAERRTKWHTASGDEYNATTVVDLDALPEPLGPGDFNNRKFEIGRAVAFSRELDDLLKAGGASNDRFDELLRKIDKHPGRGTPYNAAIKSLRRRTELAGKGVRPPEPVIIRVDRQQPAPKAVEVGQAAPELALRDVEAGTLLPLASLRGKPVVLVFFESTAKPDDHIIRYLRAASRDYAGRVHVVPLMVDGDSVAVQRVRLGLPIYAGRPALAALGFSTPRAIILDGKGLVRLIAPGWDADYVDLINKALNKIVIDKPN
jgi:hypothetical protein